MSWADTADNASFALVIMVLIGALTFSCDREESRRHEERMARGDAPCLEDQAYVVARDVNPAHGLTWVCVPLKELKGAE